jgi:hypothetical protein
MFAALATRRRFVSLSRKSAGTFGGLPHPDEYNTHDTIPLMKKWPFWLGVSISILFIWLAVRGLKLNEFWEAVKQANYIWLLPGIAVYFIGVWVRAW